MSHDRVVKHTKVGGFYLLPMGVSFLQYKVGNEPSHVEVSTVCLDGAHLEDPLRMVDEEHGYETMVFLAGCSFFSIYTEHYETREAAAAGHGRIIDGIVAGTLPLAMPINYRGELPSPAKEDKE